MNEDRPELIVDIVFEDGLLHIVLRNIGGRPALRVKTVFEPKFHGLGGTRDVSSLPLFQNIEFFAPQKEIRTLLDSSAAYFARREPTLLTAHITYADEASKPYTAAFRHDLEIYRSIAYIRSRPHA